MFSYYSEVVTIPDRQGACFIHVGRGFSALVVYRQQRYLYLTFVQAESFSNTTPAQSRQRLLPGKAID